MMSVHEVTKHPQFISSNRHVMQGYVDVLKTDWNPATRKLTGTSKVVGGETYKLVIATNGRKPASCFAQGAKAEIQGDQQRGGRHCRPQHRRKRERDRGLVGVLPEVKPMVELLTLSMAFQHLPARAEHAHRADSAG